ncbi:MAG: patatin-like phospholipase family protein [Gemmatimonadales bacterium]|jgi:predicted acylesterase/phospholipase RssA
MTATRITAVFGGGGAKSAAQIGALRALEEANLAPTRYVGTSMGGVIAAGAASGASAAELSQRFRAVKVTQVARPRAFAPLAGLWYRSLLRAEPLHATLHRLVPQQTFAELRHPLTLTTVDADTRELLTLGDGGLDLPLQDALAATTALPVYYPPMEAAGRRLVDGGLRAVLPLDIAAQFDADLVVAVDVGPGFDEPPPTQRVRAPGLLLAHDMGEGALMAQQAQDALARWRMAPGRPRLIHVRPPLPRRATFAAELFLEFERAGYDTTRAALAQEQHHD